MSAIGSSIDSNTNSTQNRFAQNLEINSELYSASPEYKELVDRVEKQLCASVDQKLTLKELKGIAYKIFAGTNFVKRDLSSNYRILWMIFFSLDPRPEDVASVLFRTYEDFLNDKKEEASLPSEREFQVLAESEEMIPVSYGGGMRFFQVFSEGKHPGYANEAGGKGLFVTIQTEDISRSYKERDWSYAERTPLQHFDEPFTLKGEIPAKYLHRVNHNAYEAVIFAENISHLKITETEVSPPTLDLGYSARKKMVEPILPPGRFCFGGPRSIDLEPTLFDKIKDQYDTVRLDRIRDLIYDLYT